MAWFGDGLPSLSNLKGQITNFTKEVLSDGIVEEIGVYDFSFTRDTINGYCCFLYAQRRRLLTTVNIRVCFTNRIATKWREI